MHSDPEIVVLRLQSSDGVEGSGLFVVQDLVDSVGPLHRSGFLPRGSMAAQVSVLKGMSSHERFSRAVRLQQCTEYLSVCQCLFEMDD